MSDLSEKSTLFASLHRPGRPVVLLNCWTPATAIIAEKSGASALATGSHSIANAFGFEDGEECPLELSLLVVRYICAATALPVTHDLERGYGQTPAQVAQSCRAVIEAGAIGINIEDSLADGSLRDPGDQADRIGAARSAFDAVISEGVINARCDVFFQKSKPDNGPAIEAVLDRAARYKAAGATCLFVPGLSDIELITQLCERAPLPINIMRTMNGPSIEELSKAGVARISHGPFPYIKAMKTFSELAQSVYQ